MHPKDREGIANSVDPDQSLIWIYTVCQDMSVRKLRIITVPAEIYKQEGGSPKSDQFPCMQWKTICIVCYSNVDFSLLSTVCKSFVESLYMIIQVFCKKFSKDSGKTDEQ